MNKPLLVHPEAKIESQAAYDWYFSRSSRAADKFKQELVAAYEAIRADPERFAAYPYGPGQYRQLHRFPYITSQFTLNTTIT